MHPHSAALHYAHYNFVKIHQTLRVTLAIAAGVTSGRYLTTPPEPATTPGRNSTTRLSGGIIALLRY